MDGQTGVSKVSQALRLLREKGEESKAFELLKECVGEGDASAVWLLGLCFEFGIGIESNPEQAEALYQKSAQMDDSIGLILKRNIKKFGVACSTIKFLGETISSF